MENVAQISTQLLLLYSIFVDICGVKNQYVIATFCSKFPSPNFKGW